MPRRLLIIGARHGSLGAHCADVARRAYANHWRVVTTAGVTDEQIELDVTNYNDFEKVESYTDVICTVGVSEEWDEWGPDNVMNVNATYPLMLLDHWCKHATTWNEERVCWAMVSSNSAHVVRSSSPFYCASKAALSMGTMAIARREAKRNRPKDRAWCDRHIWGYEPGFLTNTPMSQETVRSFGDMPHRMPDGRDGISPKVLAHIIVGDMVNGSALRTCSMQRIDAGDQ